MRVALVLGVIGHLLRYFWLAFAPPLALALADGDALGQLGIVRQRQAAVQALARALADGHLSLDASADVPTTLAALTALPGIGDWTAQYIAMRGLRHPDAFPAGDLVLRKQAGDGATITEKQLRDRAEAWRPWRSYAVIQLWHAASNAPISNQEPSP